MNAKLTVACIQTNSAPEVEINLDRIAPMIRSARERGAELITLPENVSLMIVGRERLYGRARPETDNLAVQFFGQIARETGAWILAGSIPIPCNHERLANRSYLFNPAGEIAARYDKIHMFDADLGANQIFRESANYRSGNAAVLVPTPWGKLGMTICYDVRFPHLYRALAKAGATIITVPAAFVATTGKLHWHVLLRARAIETGCYIIAPAQCGSHDGGRETYGHSLIIAPSGEILAEGGDEPDVIMAEIDLANVTATRLMLPCLQHDCEFERPVIA